MLLNIVTVVAVLLFISIPVYAVRRGSSSAFFAGVCVMLSGLAANAIGQSVASAQAASGAQQHITQGIWALCAFIPLFLAAFPLGHYMSRFYPFSLDPFDFVFSATFGLVVAFVALRVTLGAFVYSQETKPDHKALTKHYVVRQVVYLEGWNHVVKSMTGLYDKSTQEKPDLIEKID